MTRTWELISSQRAYMADAMQKVSRSFALVVPWLDAPLNDYLATAYLLCRVIDNVEDGGHVFAWQRVRFAELVQMLDDPALAPDILATWESETWPGLSSGEAELMSTAGGAPLWQIYAALPGQVRATMAHWLKEMIWGMESVEDPDLTDAKVWRQGIRLLATEEEYNRYCYFVAGTVGHLATALVVEQYQIKGELADRLTARAEACGRSLQKTNIVKDFVEDLERGVCYLPDQWMQGISHRPLALTGAPAEWTRGVLDNVVHELRSAVEYVTSLPSYVHGYRMASLLCLLPAYQTLLKAATNHGALFTARHNAKISRPTMAKCIHQAASLVGDDDGIVRYNQKLEAAVAAAFAT